MICDANCAGYQFIFQLVTSVVAGPRIIRCISDKVPVDEFFGHSDSEVPRRMLSPFRHRHTLTSRHVTSIHVLHCLPRRAVDNFPLSSQVKKVEAKPGATTEEARSAYYIQLAAARFGLMVPGMGYDCFRNWEMLLMGSLGVIERAIGFDRTVLCDCVTVWLCDCATRIISACTSVAFCTPSFRVETSSACSNSGLMCSAVLASTCAAG